MHIKSIPTGCWALVWNPLTAKPKNGHVKPKPNTPNNALCSSCYVVFGGPRPSGQNPDIAAKKNAFTSLSYGLLKVVRS